MRVLLLLLFTHLLGFCYGAEVDETKSIHRGQSVNLECRIDADKCGELHSIKWFKGSERIGVASGDGKFSQVEGSFAERLAIEYLSGKASRLIIKAVQIDDEDEYSCEITYLEPLDTCDTTGEYRIDLRVIVPPSAILMLHKDDNVIRNGSTLGPLKEGHRLETICEVRGARPQPIIGWYRSGKKLMATETVDEWNGLFTAKSKLILNLSRQELGNIIECRVKITDNDPIISNQLFIDLQVRPTKIYLSGVKSHVVEGSKVLLQCHVHGARPAANVYWFNSSKIIDNSNQLTTISTKTILQSDGTFETVSQMIFTATRFENNAMIRCEADNVVMRNEMDKPLHDSLALEVMYPPVVVVKPDNITINETGEFLLFCEYDANPASLASVRWLQNSTVLNLNQSRFDGGNPEQTALLVKNATREDRGAYSCELSNQVGTGMSENGVVVDVQYKPTVSIRFEPPSPIIENDHVNVTLHCDVTDGNPHKLLKVQWMINGDVLTVLPECNEDLFDDDIDEDDDKIQKNNFCSLNPTIILLQNVNREFLGNYSCRGYNSAGWGETSESQLLDVFHEPGNASVSVYPPIPIKGQSMVLTCVVDDPGNPKSTRFRWLQGDDLVKDIVTSEWTIYPVGLRNRNNYSCYAFNDGGNGTMATISINVNVPPKFIIPLLPYTGFLYSEPKIVLSCRIECVPNCTIYWFKNGDEITKSNELYTIKETFLPAHTSTADFESVSSELHFNMDAWPNKMLDADKDSANYTCSSSDNNVGMGVRSATSFGIEFPPKDVTVTELEVKVEEGKIPANQVCRASAHPTANIYWKRLDSNSVPGETSNGGVLKWKDGLNRTNSGVYSCIAENKHGMSVANITINILYAPNCTITRKQDDGEDSLICVAIGNPEEYQYEWDFKSENETNVDKNLQFRQRNKKSYLVLGDVPHIRTYVCRANNTVGPGSYCEISVEGHLMWWHKYWPLTPLVAIVVIIVACLIAVIILICIIICMCRRRRKRSSKSMEKSLVDSKPNDPNAEPCENYENLPFHGLQNPPTKSLKASDFDEFDGVYADLDEDNHYGPINYKQASIYQFTKFKGNSK